MIVVWGIDNNLCTSYQGFRKEFDSSADADRFIAMQCAKINKHRLDQYAIYITDETASLDKVMTLHNKSLINSTINLESYGLTVVDIESIKDKVDLEYSAGKQREGNAKMKIRHDVNNMSNEEYRKQKKLFTESGLA